MTGCEANPPACLEISASVVGFLLLLYSSAGVQVRSETGRVGPNKGERNAETTRENKEEETESQPRTTEDPVVQEESKQVKFKLRCRLALYNQKVGSSSCWTHEQQIDRQIER